jgi:hypothetical protein
MDGWRAGGMGGKGRPASWRVVEVKNGFREGRGAGAGHLFTHTRTRTKTRARTHARTHARTRARTRARAHQGASAFAAAYPALPAPPGAVTGITLSSDLPSDHARAEVGGDVRADRHGPPVRATRPRAACVRTRGGVMRRAQRPNPPAPTYTREQDSTQLLTRHLGCQGGYGRGGVREVRSRSGRRPALLAGSPSALADGEDMSWLGGRERGPRGGSGGRE